MVRMGVRHEYGVDARELLDGNTRRAYPRQKFTERRIKIGVG
jgi:hypothetical protein